MSKLELIASINITICQESEAKSFKMEDLQIKEVNKLMDGGVYLFTINKVPLYVGETYNFFIRLSKHLVELDKDCDYFGLSQLEGKYYLRFYIIEDGLPYNKIKLKKNKRHTDGNKECRTIHEKNALKKYRPMTQQLPRGCNIQYKSNKKYDGMIKDGEEKSEIVKEILEAPNKYGYEEIIDMINKMILKM